MPITKRLTTENINLDDDAELDAFDDQVITAGLERVRAEGDDSAVEASSMHRAMSS
jgi:hypothetical protein